MSEQRCVRAARLRDVGPGTALSIVAFLGFGGPKRLVLAMAMASVGNADLGDVEILTLLALYVAVATLLVPIPVGFVIVGGDRTIAAVGRGASWFETNSVVLRVWAGVGLGAALVLDGLVRLA